MKVSRVRLRRRRPTRAEAAEELGLEAQQNLGNQVVVSLKDGFLCVYRYMYIYIYMCIYSTYIYMYIFIHMHGIYPISYGNIESYVDVFITHSNLGKFHHDLTGGIMRGILWYT